MASKHVFFSTFANSADARQKENAFCRGPKIRENPKMHFAKSAKRVQKKNAFCKISRIPATKKRVLQNQQNPGNKKRVLQNQ